MGSSPMRITKQKRNSHYDYSSFCISFIIPLRFHSSSFSFYSSGNYRLVKSPAAISYVICRVLIPLSFCTTVRPSNHPFPSCLMPHHIPLTLLISNKVIAKFRIPAKYLSPLASSLTSISYNNLVSFSTQGQKLTVYSFQVCCHFCHSFFAFKLLIVKSLFKMLKVTATKIKTILGFLR